MGNDLHSIHRSPLEVVGGSAGNRSQCEACGRDEKNDIVAGRIIGLREGATKIDVGGIGEIDDCRGDSCSGDLIGAGARGADVVAVSINIDVVTRSAGRKTRNGDRSVLAHRVEIPVHHAKVARRIGDGEAPRG